MDCVLKAYPPVLINSHNKNPLSSHARDFTQEDPLFHNSLNYASMFLPMDQPHFWK